jgi:nitrite reductase (NO-forming)
VPGRRLLAATALAGAAWLLASVVAAWTGDSSQRSLPTAANVVRNPLDVPPASSGRRPRHVRVHLIAKEVVAEIAPGERFVFWTYELARGRRVKRPAVPGPMIRVTAGDTLSVTLTNDARNLEPHGIDFHAASGPGGGTDMVDLQPGETRTFTFRALRPGAYVYHCGGEGKPWEHVSHGMFGLIEVDPPGGLPAGYRELYVGQSEWYLGGGSVRDLDEQKAAAETPDLVTFNGHAEALTSPKLAAGALRLKTGERVRIFFANGGPNLSSSLHVIGAIFDRAYSADRRDARRNEETVAVPPGSATVVELRPSAPGPYPFVDHALWRAAKGATGYLYVEPARE